jgi:hypothetical protein
MKQVEGDHPKDDHKDRCRYVEGLVQNPMQMEMTGVGKTGIDLAGKPIRVNLDLPGFKSLFGKNQNYA